MHQPERWIAHLDMDAFYASVELLRYPQLKGEAVVIGGRRADAPQQLEDGSWKYSKLRDYTGRGVVTTSTYAARDLGVFSAMGLMKAALRAPDAILLPADFDSYRKYSRLFKAAVAEVAPVIEDRGIDEIYIDLTDVPGVRDAVGHDPLGGVKAVAREIKNSVGRATGLTCSIGVTPNKLLSKIASELDKPDGISVLTLDDIPARVWPLGVRKINGIGPKASEKLIKLGIETVGDIAAADPRWLIEQFGDSYGHWLHNASHGRDSRPVVTHSEPVSISRETTFERDLSAVHDRLLLGQIMDELCESLSRDLARKRYAGKTVGIKLRFEGFVTVTRDQTVKLPISSAADIRRAVGLCLKRVRFDKRLRLMGVRIGNLVHASEVQAAPAAARAEPLPAPDNLSLF
ncbi:DNA polymerase-4 [Pelomonas saccharophila]|uniref:DNA polymerase IV n=1 Tax=Roseateles saccharophilus TaxID=304 RepID=A0ABU1YHD7_ROSSA|nr:DNA polymerase IV [Roseateles saccharophilus]MDR7268260.1 DNA polymerase-4 [Roseateles saccharophilus]